jgi:hypothetical protein
MTGLVSALPAAHSVEMNVAEHHYPQRRMTGLVSVPSAAHPVEKNIAEQHYLQILPEQHLQKLLEAIHIHHPSQLRATAK